MPSVINASSSGAGGLISTGDSSGSLNIQTAGTTAIAISSAQVVTVQGLTVGKGGGTNPYNTTFGVTAGASNTSGAGNLFVGYQAGNKNTTGSGNSFVGGVNSLGAGYNNTSGSNNTAFGSDSLASNTTASENTAVGYQSMYTNTTGQYNTAIGHTSLRGNTTASGNTALGYGSMITNTTGAYNTAVGGADTNGLGSLFANTTGSYNVAMGNGALKSNTTASNNVAIGYTAGYSNTTGIRNTHIGTKAGYTTTTTLGQTIVGYQAGFAATGDLNTLLGYESGYNTTGGYNTFVGQASGSEVTSGTKNAILGSYNGNQGGLDIRTASNNIVLSDGDGNPKAYCTSSASWRFGDGTANSGGELFLNSAANSGWGPVLSGRTGAIGSSTSRWFVGSNSWIKGGTAYDTLTCAAGATGSGGVNLTSGATSWASASDARLKDVTGTYGNALSDIAQIQPVKFTWKADADKKPCVGVIAQSVENIVPEAIETVRASKEDETDYLSVRYTELIPLMIASIQELNAKVEAQAAEIATLKGNA